MLATWWTIWEFLTQTTKHVNSLPHHHLCLASMDSQIREDISKLMVQEILPHLKGVLSVSNKQCKNKGLLLNHICNNVSSKKLELLRRAGVQMAIYSQPNYFVGIVLFIHRPKKTVWFISITCGTVEPPQMSSEMILKMTRDTDDVVCAG